MFNRLAKLSTVTRKSHQWRGPRTRVEPANGSHRKLTDVIVIVSNL